MSLVELELLICPHLGRELRNLVVVEAAARSALKVAAQSVAAHDDPGVPVCRRGGDGRHSVRADMPMPVC